MGFSWGWIELITELVVGLIFAVDLHLDLALLGPQYDRLFAEPADHVEWALRRPAQRQLLHVVGDATLDHRAQLLRDRKEPIRRTQAVEPLVRTFVIVVLHPPPHALLRLLEAVELRPFQKLLPDCFPEALDFAQRHGVVRLAAEMMHPVFGQFLLEARPPTPGGVLPAIVGEHLLGHPVLRDRRAIDLQNMVRRLAAKQSQPDHVPRVVIQERDQVGVATPQPEHEDVALPHLVGRRPLEEAGLGRIAARFAPGLLHQPLLMQTAPHRFPADR